MGGRQRSNDERVDGEMKNEGDWGVRVEPRRTGKGEEKWCQPGSIEKGPEWPGREHDHV